MAEQQEFKFPDEIEETKASSEQDSGDSLDIQVIDDTPTKDRDRAPLPKEVVEDLENDSLDEYSEKVKNKLIQMKRVYHDERRAKEAAAREKEEALRFAQAQYEENRQLKQRLGTGERVFAQEITKAANTELNSAKDKLRAAYESGDAEAITAAQEVLTDAKLRLRDVERFRPSLQDSELGVNNENKQVQNQPQYNAPPVDPKAEAWRQSNTWFGTDEEMTALALGLHEKLVRAKVDPRSDEYYKQIDQTMRRRFPEYFEGEADQTREVEKPTRTKAANVVAPVTRTTAPRQIRLTTTQVALAKRLGLSNEQYARELMKLENNNG
jgi:hypothetical protein